MCGCEWEWNGESVWHNDRFQRDRWFLARAIPRLNALGENTREVSRYEICEIWTSREQPEMWGRGFYIKHDKEVAVFFFTEQQEARNFLKLLCWVLNAPSEIPMSQIISTSLVNTLANANTEEMHTLWEKESLEREMHKKNVKIHGTHVYILALDNDTVKIGVSVKPLSRARLVKGLSGHNIIDWCYTQGLSHDDGYALEATMHTFFADRRTCGEFFKVPYEEARDKLRSMVDDDLVKYKN